LKSAQNFGSFDIHISLFEEKNFYPYLADFLLLGDKKCHFRNEPLNIQKKVLNKLILDFSSGSKSTWKKLQSKNRLPLFFCTLHPVEYKGQEGTQQTSPFCKFCHVYSLMGRPENVLICCGGQARGRNAQK
jgi:hypothetical protein